MKLRISKSGQFAKALPKPVADKVREIAQDYRLSSCQFSPVPSDKEFVVGEGERYYGIFPDGRTVEFEVQAQHNIGASGLSQAINSVFSMPSNTYLVVIGYYQGYHMSVYRIKSTSNSYELALAEAKISDWQTRYDK